MIKLEELLKRRGHTSTKLLAGIVASVVAYLLGGAVASNASWPQYYCFMLLHLLWYTDVVILAEILRRLTLLFEEQQHLASRYQNSIKKLLTETFNFSYCSRILFGIALVSHILLFCFFSYETECALSFEQASYIFVVYLLLDLACIRKSPVSDSVFLDSLERLDYGSGMAQSFFYGYLRICLPDEGDQGKGIVERIDDYISKEKLCSTSFPVRKLFILIPTSAYIPNDLKEASYNWMEHQGALEKLVKNRAGVIERVYKNSVYKIKDPECTNDEDSFYAVVEGATPCKTLHEVVQFSGIRKELYVKNMNDIIFRFYDTLIELLNDPVHENCKNLCEFIYYVDKDELGERVNVAHIIQQRVREIKRKEQETRQRHLKRQN